MADYSFYITLYEDNVRHNLETEFTCKYRSLKGLLEFGKIKNVYKESYAERSMPRIYLPNGEFTRETTTCELTVLFDAATCIANSLKLQTLLQGKVFEWYDTFRKKYATFLMLEQPKIATGEKLYGNRLYRDVTYTLENLYGECFDRSQIPT